MFGSKKTSGDKTGSGEGADFDETQPDEQSVGDESADEGSAYLHAGPAIRSGRKSPIGLVSVLALLVVIGGGAAMVMTGGDFSALLGKDADAPAAATDVIPSPQADVAPMPGGASLDAAAMVDPATVSPDPFADEAERMSAGMPPAPPMPMTEGMGPDGAANMPAPDLSAVSGDMSDAALPGAAPASEPADMMSEDDILSPTAVGEPQMPADTGMPEPDPDTAVSSEGTPATPGIDAPEALAAEAVTEPLPPSEPESAPPSQTETPPAAEDAAEKKAVPPEHAMNAQQEAVADEAALDEADDAAPKEIIGLESVSGDTAPVAPDMTAPLPVPAEAAPVLPMAEPSVAEKALVDNASKLDKLAPPVAPTLTAPAALAPQNFQLPVTKAPIRPLPDGYFVLRKDKMASTTETRMKAANRALADGNPAAAVEMYDRLLGSSPRDEKVLMGRAVALQQAGQNTSALDAYEDVLRVNPKNLDALTNMLGLLRKQSPGLALDRLKELHDTYPFNVAVTAQLGTVYGDMGRYDEGLKLLDQALSMAPTSAVYMFNKAVLYDRMGNAPSAAAMYRAALDANYRDDGKQPIPVEAIKKRMSALQ